MEYKVLENVQTEKVDKSDISNTEVCEQLLDEMEEMVNIVRSEKALGLASNQMGFKNNHCIVRDMSTQELIWMINPEITDRFGAVRPSIEGCLSWPDKYIYASRYEYVKVKYIDDSFHEVTRDFKNLGSIIVQHEVDHLTGIEERLVNKDYRTVRNGLKVGRNEPCPCKSGKKYKKCCMGKFNNG